MNKPPQNIRRHKDHPWLGDIHPADWDAAISVRARHRLADTKRAARNSKTAAEIQQDLFIASLVSWGGLSRWPDWLRQYVINYAADDGGPQFLERLGKALSKGKAKWFDKTDVFILCNWRSGHCLHIKTRAEAVLILRKMKEHHEKLDNVMPLAQEFYASRIKRLGLQGQHSELPGGWTLL